MLIVQLPEPKFDPWMQYTGWGVAVVAILAMVAVMKMFVPTMLSLVKTLEALKTIIEERLPRRRG